MTFWKRLVHRRRNGIIAATAPAKTIHSPTTSSTSKVFSDFESKSQISVIERLPTELLVQIISILHPIDWFALRLAGSRRLLGLFRSFFSSTPFWTYLEIVEEECPKRWPHGPSLPMVLAAARGQMSLILEMLKHPPISFRSRRLSSPEMSGFHWKESKLQYYYLGIYRSDDILVKYGAEFGQEEVIRLAIDMGRGAKYAPGAVHLAAANGHVTVVRLLIAVNYRVLYGAHKQDAFVWAAQRGHDEVLRLLSRPKYFTLKQGDRGLSIVLAAKYGHQTTVRFLLAANMPVNRCDAHKLTALHYAASLGCEDMVRDLLDHGADPSLIGDTNKTALDMALQNGHGSVARLLLKYANKSYKPHFLTLPLSVRRGNEECVRTLLQLAAPRAGSLLQNHIIKDPHATLRRLTSYVDNSEVLGKGIFPVLHEAVVGGYPSIVSLLLEHNEHPNSSIYNGLTPLHFISLSYPILGSKIAEQLLDAGASIGMEDSHGRTPLHLAAQRGHAEFIRYLLLHGADIEAKTSTGQTPLHMAAANLHVEATRVFLSSGADIDVQDYSGMTPLHFAACARNMETYDLLKSHGADQNKKNRQSRIPDEEREYTKPSHNIPERLAKSHDDFVESYVRPPKTYTSNSYPAYEKINVPYFMDT